MFKRTVIVLSVAAVVAVLILAGVFVWIERPDLVRAAAEYIPDDPRVTEAYGIEREGRRLQGRHATERDLRKAEAKYLDALNIFRSLNHEQGQAELLSDLYVLYLDLHDHEKAMKYHEKWQEFKVKAGPPRVDGNSLVNLGNYYWHGRDFAKAANYYAQAVKAYEKAGDTEFAGRTLSDLGQTYRRLRRYPKAAECLETTLEKTQKIGDVEALAYTLGSLGSIHASMKDYAKASEYYLKTIELSRSHGYGYMEQDARKNLHKISGWWAKTAPKNKEMKRTQAFLAKERRNRDLIEELSQAIEAVDIEKVKALLAEGANVNGYDKRGRLPLETAAEKGPMEMVRLLVDRGADLKAENRYGHPALEAAFAKAMHFGREKVARYFLHLGANVNAVTRGRTALCHAVNCSSDFVEMLIEKGADVHAKNERGWTALNEALWKGHLDVAALLLDKGADPNAADDSGWTPLIQAAWNGQAEVVKLLITRGADIRAKDDFGKTAFMRAVEMGHCDVAALLLDKGADVNAAQRDEWTPVMAAVTRRDREMVQLLKERGARMTVAAAVLLGDEKEMNRLLEEAAKNRAPIAAGSMALLFAVRDGREDMVTYLLDNCPDIGIKDLSCDTALLFAVKEKHGGIAVALLQKGANVNAVDDWRRTVLHYAVKKGDLKFVRMLLEKGADVDAQTIGWDGAPLMSAVRSANVEMVKVLLEKGASLNAGVERGDLWEAANKSGNQEILELLKAYALKQTDKTGPTSEKDD